MKRLFFALFLRVFSGGKINNAMFSHLCISSNQYIFVRLLFLGRSSSARHQCVLPSVQRLVVILPVKNHNINIRWFRHAHDSGVSPVLHLILIMCILAFRFILRKKSKTDSPFSILMWIISFADSLTCDFIYLICP